jgi:hypothetical protein
MEEVKHEIYLTDSSATGTTELYFLGHFRESNCMHEVFNSCASTRKVIFAREGSHVLGIKQLLWSIKL